VQVGVGLAVLGVTSYGFLAFAARSLSAVGFAELSVVWTALFTLGPGVFLPLEQDIGRRLAVTRDRGVMAVVLRRSLILAAILAVLVTVATVIASIATKGRLLDRDNQLLIAMICANGALALVHPSRGYLAGTGRFGRYGAQLAVDGVLRTAGAAVLLLAATHSPAPFGWVLVGSQLIAVAVSGYGSKPPLTAHDQGEHREPRVSTLARGVGWMLAATLAQQILANAGPILVKLLAAPGDAAAGHFLTALVLARVPLFLFAALQASLLPRLALLVATGQREALIASMRRLLALLAVLGAFVTLVLAGLGPLLTQLLFGAGYRSARASLVLLSAGCTVYMLAAAVAQALLAMHLSAWVAGGWWLGIIGFAAVMPFGSDLAIRVGSAFLVGSLLSAAWFVLALRGKLRNLVPPSFGMVPS
jgi:O-antigen/teichoic acid export membrane protein